VNTRVALLRDQRRVSLLALLPVCGPILVVHGHAPRLFLAGLFRQHLLGAALGLSRPSRRRGQTKAGRLCEAPITSPPVKVQTGVALRPNSARNQKLALGITNARSVAA